MFSALCRHRFAAAAFLANLRHQCPGFFRFAVHGGPHEERPAVRLCFRKGRCTLSVNGHLLQPDGKAAIQRLLVMLSFLAACREAPAGETWLNLNDVGVRPGLAFSEYRAGFHLIPDSHYFSTRGYRKAADHYRVHEVPWADRRQIAFWRGTATGRELVDSWQDMDRVRLCRLACLHSDLFDIGLTEPGDVGPCDRAAIGAAGLLRPYVPYTEFQRYRYQIDIDGNSNSWPGLFQKLLTASPVLKIASRYGFKQWYYDRLVPWDNFVPVAADLSDLVERVHWLKAHDSEAERIGDAGRALALSMTIAAETARGRATVFAALSENSR